MPILVIGMFLGLAVIAAIALLAATEYRLFPVPAVVVIALTVWIVLAYGQTPEVLFDEVHLTQTIEHTDGSSITIMIVEGQVVNLTKEMGLSFPAGTKIRRVITSQWAGGIHWMNAKHSFRTTDPGYRKGLVSYSAVVEDK